MPCESVYPWEKGTSLSFFDDEKRRELPMFGQSGFGRREKEILRAVRQAGFTCAEMSFSYEDYMRRFQLQDTAELLREFCDEIGLKMWSLHLPFGDYWDVSAVSEADAMQENRKLLRIAQRLGCSVVVIHPSFEPIAQEHRDARYRRGKKNIALLAEDAAKLGMILGVENLPRTCLGNTSEEMCRLLEDTCAGWVFDTNHSLSEDNVHFLAEMIRNGHVPCSLHISDYDFVDERHDLPGCGVNRWRVLLDMLRAADYRGPAMYEIRRVVRQDRIISFEQMSQNIGELLAGRID